MSLPSTSPLSPEAAATPESRGVRSSSVFNVFRRRSKGPSGSSESAGLTSPAPTESTPARFKRLIVSAFKTPASRRPGISSTPAALDSTPSLASPPPAPTDAAAIPSGAPGAVSDVTASLSDSPVQIAQEALERGGRLGSRAAGNIERVPGTWEAASSTAQMWDGLVSKIGAFAGVVGAIGEVHPYLKTATGAINGIVKPIVTQVARDEKFKELLKEMSVAYDHVINDSGTVARLKELPDNRQTALLEDICCESKECALFIQDEYIKKFWARAAKNAFSGGDVDKMIDRYRSSFSSLRARWQDETLRDMKVDMMLEKLSPMRHAGPTSQRACLPGTRNDILQQIHQWIDDADSPPVLFVLGVAGSGKTALANTLAEIGQERKVLGSFFAFNRNDKSRVPERLLGTIAHHLAHWNETYRDRLAGILKADVMLADSPDILKQWERLIVEPASAISAPGPVVVVIDAFDECPEHVDGFRQRLLECLTLRASDLLARFRVLVTSRPLELVMDAVDGAPSVRRLDLSNFPAAEDIYLYVRDQIPPFSGGGLSDWDCHEIALAADGSFQWAATACRFLASKLAGTTMPAKFEANRERLIHGDPRRIQRPDGPPSLDELYSVVLEETFDASDTTVMTNFGSAVAVMLCAEVPLPITILHSIYDRARPSNGSVVRSVLGSMGVVLEGASSPGSPVRPMHLSFREFLLDPARSGSWHISGDDIAGGHLILALGGLRIMATDLSFNMHHIPSPHDPGWMTLDIPAGHEALAYTISNLHRHLKEMHHKPCGTMHSDDIRVALRGVLYHKLLFWFEWSVAREEIRATEKTLQAAQLMLTGDDLLFAKDAARFLELRNQEPSSSAPHIYLSTLPFAPADSLVRQRFIRHFPGIPTVNPLPDSWASFEGSDRVKQLSGVAWSTDGRYIREDSEDRHPYRYWDVRTGTRVHFPRGRSWRHPSHQSEDGGVKVSVTRHEDFTVLYDVKSNQPNIPAIAIKVRHGVEELSYSISPSGRWLVAQYTMLWDLETGQRVDVDFLPSGMMSTVTFSSDSREVAICDSYYSPIPVFVVDQRANGPWLSSYINFKPQPTTDAAGNLLPDASLRCQEPDIIIPDAFEHRLWRPRMRLLLGAEPLTIDFANACYGTEWARCYAGGLEGGESSESVEQTSADVEAEETEDDQ